MKTKVPLEEKSMLDILDMCYMQTNKSENQNPKHLRPGFVEKGKTKPEEMVEWL